MTRRNASNNSDQRSSNADLESMAAIRSLLHTESEKRTTAAKPQRQAQKLARPSSEAPVNDVDVAAPSSSDGKRYRLTRASKAERSKPLQADRKRGTGFVPAPRYFVIASLVMLIYFRPWLILGVLILSTLLIAGVFLILGYDGFWQRAMTMARWYAQRHPQRAAELHRKLDGFAMKWDAILDRFPEGSVDGLYLPDFGDAAAAEDRNNAVIDRRFSQLDNPQG